jgi:hypothetical protein
MNRRRVPCIGKRTRADAGSGPDSVTQERLDALSTQTPGRRTRVDTEARRWRPIEDAPTNRPVDDTDVMRRYSTSVIKGNWVGHRRLTILTARAQVRIGEPVRVIHIVEITRPGDQLCVTGPKAVLGEHVDGVLRTGSAPAIGDPLAPTGRPEDRVAPAPAVDDNWDITEYTFDTAGRHTIEWKLGELVSNLLAIEVLP